jgi:hypothetical protein
MAAKTQFPALEDEQRPTVATAPAAHYLNRQPQTLRYWASRQVGPIKPLWVHGRLAWPTAAIRKLLGVSK